MIIIKTRSCIIILFSLCFILNMQAQATYAPYSMIGLGEIENRDYGRTAGMSNIGIGIRDYDYLNMANPAGISGLDSLKFIFDLSLAGKLSFFSKNSNDRTLNGNLKKVSMGFRLAPGWGISIGIKPFSDVGYRIYSEAPIEGSSVTKTVYLEGSGGLYELCLSNGFKITDHFSIGVNTKYISGTLNQTENQSGYLFEESSYVSQVHNTFGAQYHTKGLTLGATYGYKQKIVMHNKTLIYDDAYNLLQEEKKRSKNQFIPETFGVGFSHYDKKIILGMDFTLQKWEGIDPGLGKVRITDSYRINAGLGYSFGSNRYFNYRDQSQAQVGASFYKSYIQVGGKDAYNFSVSAGYSLPLSGNLVNLVLEYGNSLSAPAGYIKESYFLLTFNCSIIDRWFMRRRFD